jgi:DUF4097 and DUF4098 domain-containing protein YvlB
MLISGKLSQNIATVTVAALIIGAPLALSGCSFGQSVEYGVYGEETAGDIESICVNTEETDVDIVFSETAEKITVEYPRKSLGGRPLNEVDISLESGRLRLDERRVLWLFSLFDSDERITVTVPAGRHLDYELSTEVGVGTLGDGVRANTLDVVTTTGDITLGSAVVTESITLTATTGDVLLSGYVAAEEISVSVTTGDINLNSDVIGNRLRIVGTTSDITASGTVKVALLSINGTTGDIFFDGVLDARVIEIDLTTGDVELDLIGFRDWYSITAESTTGDSNINGGSGERIVNIKSTTGDVRINLEGIEDTVNNM